MSDPAEPFGGLQTTHMRLPHGTFKLNGNGAISLRISNLPELAGVLAENQTFAFYVLVDEIECHRRSFKPLSTIINRPNGIGLGQLIYECLK